MSVLETDVSLLLKIKNITDNLVSSKKVKMIVNNNDSVNTTTATIIHEEVPLSAIRPRRSSIFKPNVMELNKDDKVITKEYHTKISQEHKKWRELYVDIKSEYFALKDICSKSTEEIYDGSEDYQEFLTKADNFVEEANDYFDQMKCIFAMNQNDIKLKQYNVLKLELQENAIKENFINLLNKSK